MSLLVQKWALLTAPLLYCLSGQKKHICEALCCNQSLNAEILSILSIVFDSGFGQYENTYEMFGALVFY